MVINYSKPTTLEELRALKREITALLHSYERALAERRLCAIGSKPDSYPDDKARKAAAGEPSSATIAAYKRRAAPLVRMAWHQGLDIWVLAEARARTAGSWYAARAALQFYILAETRRTKNLLDQWEKTSGTGSVDAVIAEAAKSALQYLPWLADALRSTPTGGLPDRFKQAGNGKRKRQSKSKSLAGLPSDWQLQIADALPTNFVLPWLVQCVTGCRPAELNGATVRLGADECLYAKVIGAKVRKNSGQPMRELKIRVAPGVTQRLAAELGSTGAVQGPGLLGNHTVEAYRKSVSRRGAGLCPRRAASTRPSAYSGRHQFKADLISHGMPREKVAAAMGHRTEKSASYYGGGARSGGGVVPEEVAATHSIKKRAKPAFETLKKSSRSRVAVARGAPKRPNAPKPR